MGRKIRKKLLLVLRWQGCTSPKEEIDGRRKAKLI